MLAYKNNRSFISQSSFGFVDFIFIAISYGRSLVQMGVYCVANGSWPYFTYKTLSRTLIGSFSDTLSLNSLYSSLKHGQFEI